MPKTIQMLRKQAEFYCCQKKWAAARGGVGSGKTMAMAWWMIGRVNDFPKANHVVVGADYDQLRRGFFQSLMGVLEEDVGYERGKDFVYREHPTPLLRFTRTGARVRSMSAELAQRVRSVEVQTLYCEEPQTWHNGNGADTFRAIAGRLRHSRLSDSLYPDMPLHGRMTLNPPAVGTWLYTLIERQWLSEGYPCWQFSLRDNTLLRGVDEYVRQIESMYAPDQWPVEIDGNWATIGGDVYRGFDLAIHGANAPMGLPPVAIDSSRPLLWALDFNVGWMASVVAQIHTQQQIVTGTENKPGLPPQSTYSVAVPGWQRSLIYVLDEVFLRDAGTPDALNEFLRRYGEHARKHGVYLYGDASGGARSQTMSSQSAVRSNWEIIVSGLIAAGIKVTVCVPTANPAVMDRINATRAQFRTGAGFGLLIDAQRCEHTVVDFQAVRFKPGTNDIDKSDASEEGRKRTHLSDALGYLIHTHRSALRQEPITFQSFLGR